MMRYYQKWDAQFVDGGVSGIKGCATMGDFQKWFDSQFVDYGVGRLRKMTIQQLSDAVRDGQEAAAELQRRRERQEMERAALYAWNHLMSQPEPPTCP